MTLPSRYCMFLIVTVSIVSSNDFPFVKERSITYINESERTLFRKEVSDGKNVTDMSDANKEFRNLTGNYHVTPDDEFTNYHNATLVRLERVEKKYDVIPLERIPSAVSADSYNRNEFDNHRNYDIIPVDTTPLNQMATEEELNLLLKTELTLWTQEQVRYYGNQAIWAFCGRYCTSKYLGISDPFSMYGIQCLDCSCDRDCDIYGACCLRDPQQLPEPLYDCKNQVEESIMLEGFYIRRSTCSPNWTDDATRDLCDAPPSCDQLPVTNKFRMTYRNEHCAICNKDHDYTKWKLDFNLIESTKYYQYLFSIFENIFLCNKQLFLKPPTELPYPKTCDSRRSADVIKTCNSTGLWAEYDALLEKQCLEYHTPFYYSVKQVVYENMYCYLCNGNEIGFGPSTSHSEFVVLTKLYEPPVTRNMEWDSSCNATWRFYNSHQNSCKTIECSEHLEYKEEECVPVTDDSKILHFMLNISSIKNIRHKVKKSLEKLGIHRYIATLGVIQQNVYLHVFCHSNFHFAAKLLSLVKSDWTFGSHVTIKNLLNKEWTKIWEMISDDVYMSCCQGNINKTDQSPTMLEISDFKICPYILHEETEFEILTNDTQTLRMKNTSLIFTKEEYQSHYYGRKIKICVNTLKEKIAEINSGDLELFHKMDFYITIVQTVMSVLSLACLALTFITYCTFSVLRTLPAKNNMALIVCLFFAQFSLIISNFSSVGTTICKIIGIFVHYSWLSVFFWMNVCSFHMFTVFKSTNVASSSSTGHWKRLLKYFLFANGTPAVMVSTVIVVSMTTTDSIGYGDRFCYLDEPSYVLISTTVPLMIIIIFNISFLGITIYSISKASDIARASGKDRHHMKVYIKLSTFTGLFWTIEMMSNFFYPQALMLISAILNYSQGIFLFLSYVANKRVARLWLGLCRKQWREATDSKTSSSQTKSTNI